MLFVKRILKWFVVSFLLIFVFVSALPYIFPLQEGESFMARRDYFANSQIDEIEGVWIHYRVFEAQGKKKGNILLIHGFSGSTFSWRKNVSFLQERGYQVLCIDLPAFGYSDRLPTWDHSVENRANIAWQVAEKVSPEESWAIAGHSMGASVALAMGQLKSEKTQKIFCVDGLFFNHTQSGFFGDLLISYPPIQRWAEVLLQSYFSKKSKFKEILHSAYSQEPDQEAIEGYLAPMLVRGTATAILSSMRAKSNFKLDYQLVSPKMVLIWGKNDLWISPNIAEDWHKNHTQVPFISIEKAGHCPMETHPQQFNGILEKYLNL